MAQQPTPDAETESSSPKPIPSESLRATRTLLLTATMTPPSTFAPEPSPTPPCPLPIVLRNALSSTAGASVVATVVTPLDVIKVRLQAHICLIPTTPTGLRVCADPNHLTGAVDAARKIVASDGIRGLWRGLNASLVLALPTTGLYFTMYESFRAQLEERGIGVTSALWAGAGARVAAACVASPLELARTSLQAGVGGRDATVVSVLRGVWIRDGGRALWRGLGPTLLRDAPFSAIYWSCYERLKMRARGRVGNEFVGYLGSGILAGGLAALCTVPADVVKTRRQADFKGPGSLEIGRRILRDEGVRGLFRGAGPRVGKVAPACAIMMGSFEFFRSLLGGF